jgi:hypothetical protein
MSDEQELRRALRDLRDASLAALLAYKSGCLLGTEYGDELEQAIFQAKRALQ